MGATIEQAVQLALGGFLELAAASTRRGPGHAASSPALDGAYALGPGRGARRPLDGRAARRLPGRRPRGLAGDGGRPRSGRG